MDIFGDVNKRTPIDFNSVVNSNNLTYWSISLAPVVSNRNVKLNATFKQGGMTCELEKYFDTIMEEVEYLYNFLKSV